MTTREAHEYLDLLLLEEGVGYLAPEEKDDLLHAAQLHLTRETLAAGPDGHGAGRDRLAHVDLRCLLVAGEYPVDERGNLALGAPDAFALISAVTLQSGREVEYVWREDLPARLSSSIVAPDDAHPIYCELTPLVYRVYPIGVADVVNVLAWAYPPAPDSSDESDALVWGETAARAVVRRAADLKVYALRDAAAAQLTPLKNDPAR